MNKSLLVEFLGDSPLTRIIDFIIDNRPFDASKTDIANMSGVSKAALFNNWWRLEKYGLVKISRQYGNTKLYKLNSESPIAKQLLDLDMTLMKSFLNKQKIAVRVK